MIRHVPLALLALAVPLVPSPHAAAAPRLAVLTPSAPWSARCAAPGKSRDEKLEERCTVLETLADEVRAGALAALDGRDVDVMTRENTAQLLKEMGAGATCSEGECEVETAKLIGADYVVSGNVVLVERTWLVTMKLHEVNTAKLLRTSDRLEGRTQLAVIRAVRPAAEALVRAALRLGPAQGASAATPPSPLASKRAEEKLGAILAGMVRLAGGAYTMGQAKRTVTVQPFLLDVTEVTVAAYAECVRAGGCSAAWSTVESPFVRSDADRAKYSAACNRAKPDRANHPVNCVDWNQAAAYCATVGKRLPTEEEWEWAARGAKEGTTYAWGNEEPASQLCWDRSGSDLGAGNRTGTCQVAGHPRGDSPQGVKDLAGNVWEWTSSAEGENRVYRGGGWYGRDATLVAAASRGRSEPSSRGGYIGFRCAKDAQ